MSPKTGIRWTTSTFNPWWGCSRVSPGCVHCGTGRPWLRPGAVGRLGCGGDLVSGWRTAQQCRVVVYLVAKARIEMAGGSSVTGGLDAVAGAVAGEDAQGRAARLAIRLTCARADASRCRLRRSGHGERHHERQERDAHESGPAQKLPARVRGEPDVPGEHLDESGFAQSLDRQQRPAFVGWGPDLRLQELRELLDVRLAIAMSEDQACGPVETVCLMPVAIVDDDFALDLPHDKSVRPVPWPHRVHLRRGDCSRDTGSLIPKGRRRFPGSARAAET
jgi:hypothetical protein